MTESFEVTELVRLFRSGLLALLPVMDSARIIWRAPNAYDPWENLERTLYESIIGSCVENAEPPRFQPFAGYGCSYQDYTGRSFLSERALRIETATNALVELRTSTEPFDLALLRELDTGLIPTGRDFIRPIKLCRFDVAASVAGRMAYQSHVRFQP